MRRFLAGHAVSGAAIRWQAHSAWWFVGGLRVGEQDEVGHARVGRCACSDGFPGIATVPFAVDLPGLVDGTDALVAAMRAGKYVELAAERGWDIVVGGARFDTDGSGPLLNVDLATSANCRWSWRSVPASAGDCRWRAPTRAAATSPSRSILRGVANLLAMTEERGLAIVRVAVGDALGLLRGADPGRYAGRRCLPTDCPTSASLSGAGMPRPARRSTRRR